MSASGGGSSSAKSVTSKPWFFTYHGDDIFTWKGGARLHLKNGRSAGRVRGISVLNREEKTVTVSKVLDIYRWCNNNYGIILLYHSYHVCTRTQCHCKTIKRNNCPATGYGCGWKPGI